MAATRTQPKPEATGHDLDDLTEVLTTTVRVLARVIVRQSQGQGPATFAQIASHQLHVATDQEAAVLTRWLEEHP
jgi:hypothetical protein